MKALRENNRLERRDWTNTHLHGGQFDQDSPLVLSERVLRDAPENGFPLVRVVTGMAWALETDLDLNQRLAHEAPAIGLRLRPKGPASAYDLPTKFRGDVVADVLRAHPFIVIGDPAAESFFPPSRQLLETTPRNGVIPLNSTNCT